MEGEQRESENKRGREKIGKKKDRKEKREGGRESKSEFAFDLSGSLRQ
jgi:hypothetical protein